MILAESSARALVRAGMAVGLAALFLEAQANPDQVHGDDPSGLPLAELEPFLFQVKSLKIWSNLSLLWKLNNHEY